MQKHFLQSKTILGIISAILGFILKIAITKGWLSADMGEMVSELISYLADAFGFGGLALATYGRVKTNGESLTIAKSQ